VGNKSDRRRLGKARRRARLFSRSVPRHGGADSYDPQLLAQVFRIKTDQAGGFRNAVIFTALLDDYLPTKIAKLLTDLNVAERLRSAKGTEVLVTSWGVEEKEG
jgi:hypothetical protein